MKALRIYGAVPAGHLVLLEEQPLTETEVAAFSEYTRLEAAVEEVEPLQAVRNRRSGVAELRATSACRGYATHQSGTVRLYSDEVEEPAVRMALQRVLRRWRRTKSVVPKSTAAGVPEQATARKDRAPYDGTIRRKLARRLESAGYHKAGAAPATPHGADLRSSATVRRSSSSRSPQHSAAAVSAQQPGKERAL